MDNCNLSDKEENNTAVLYAAVSVTSLFLVIGAPLNAMLMGIIIKKLFTRPSFILLLNLAITNLLTCLLFMPLTIAYGIQVLADSKGCTLTSKLCQIAGFFSGMPLVSTYTVVLMAVDRVIYLKKPLRYGDIVTPCRMCTAILGVWLFCFVISITVIILNAVLLKPNAEFNTLCFPISIGALHEYLNIFLWFVLLFPEAVELVCWVCIIYIARKHLKRKLHGVLSHFGSTRVQTQRTKVRVQKRRDPKEYKKGQLQLVKLFAAFFATSFLTAFVVIVCGSFRSNASKLISYLTVLSHSILLPLMEVYLTQETRSAILNVFARCSGTHTHCCKRPHYSEEAGNACTPAFPESRVKNESFLESGGKSAEGTTESGAEKAKSIQSPDSSGGGADSALPPSPS